MANKRKIKCECCWKKVQLFANRKYCSACSVHHKDLLHRLNYYKRIVRELKIKIYGVPDGNERLR